MKKFSLSAVEEYLNKCADLLGVDVIEGCLIDTLILYHDNGIIEVFEETYLNCWSSAYTRHVYKKGLPKRFETALAEQAEAIDIVMREKLVNVIGDSENELSVDKYGFYA